MVNVELVESKDGGLSKSQESSQPTMTQKASEPTESVLSPSLPIPEEGQSIRMAQIREFEEQQKLQVDFFESIKNDPTIIIKLFNDRLIADSMLQIDYHHLNEEKVRLTSELQDLEQELHKHQECLAINTEFKLDSRTYEEKEAQKQEIHEIQDEQVKNQIFEM